MKCAASDRLCAAACVTPERVLWELLLRPLGRRVQNTHLVRSPACARPQPAGQQAGRSRAQAPVPTAAAVRRRMVLALLLLQQQRRSRWRCAAGRGS